MYVYRLYLLTITCLSLVSCVSDSDFLPVLDQDEVIRQLTSAYDLMPEESISVSGHSEVYAFYAQPTTIYGHGILGDKIEAKMLVVAVDNQVYELTLGEDFVFEDIRPRLYDVDRDGTLEVIAIRTLLSGGAGVVIYTIQNNQLTEYAYVPVINKAYRWLNIVTIDDLDNDGIVELVWVETPHIGGILKVAKITQGELAVSDTQREYSNHAIGERNLCLSTLTATDDQRVFYVPNQSRDSIVGFGYADEKFIPTSTIALDVDFSRKLSEQYDFVGTIEEGDNCIEG